MSQGHSSYRIWGHWDVHMCMYGHTDIHLAWTSTHTHTHTLPHFVTSKQSLETRVPPGEQQVHGPLTLCGGWGGASSPWSCPAGQSFQRCIQGPGDIVLSGLPNTWPGLGLTREAGRNAYLTDLRQSPMFCLGPWPAALCQGCFLRSKGKHCCCPVARQTSSWL